MWMSFDKTILNLSFKYNVNEKKMNNIIMAALVVASLLSVPQSSIALTQQSHSAIQDDVLLGFEAEVEKIRKEWNVPGMAVVIVKGNQVLYAKGHGLRDVDRKLPMTADTLLQIGSSTKSFATAAIASLVEEGKLDWNKPVKTWLPSFKLQDNLATERVSLLDMVTHRTGLPRHDMVWYNAPSLTLAGMTDSLRYLEPGKDFRTQFQYNNLMYIAAGHVTEVVSGKSWQNTVNERFLQPLGMTRSNFSAAQSQRDSNFSFGYKKDKNEPLRVMRFSPTDHIAPAGGIFSSVNEMAAWLQMHLNKGQYQGKQILSAKSIDFLHTPQMLSDGDVTPELVPTGYAPGWFTAFYRGHRRIEHSGIIDGFSSSMVMFPDDKIGIMVLANLFMTSAHAYTSRAAADRLLHLSRVDWSARGLERLAKGEEHNMDAVLPEKRITGTQPSHPLSEFTGIFEHPAYGTVTVTEHQGKLSFEFHGVVTPLQHWHYDMFLGERAVVDPMFDKQRILFNTAPEGDVRSLQMDLQNGVLDIVFSRRVKQK